MSFTPYQSDAEAWKKHFQEMADGKMDYSGSFYRLSNVEKSKSAPIDAIKVVAPTAQVIEQARAELKREDQQSRKRASPQFTNRKPPSKRGKSKLLKESESDFFSV